jgi:hypothetical protein
MMAKLNGASALPADAQNFLAAYKKHLGEMSEVDATETTIVELYKAYYAEMGGVGAPPDVQRRQAEPVADNVTAFRRPPPRPKGQTSFNLPGKKQLPVVLIFAGLVVVWVGIRYLFG